MSTPQISTAIFPTSPPHGANTGRYSCALSRKRLSRAPSRIPFARLDRKPRFISRFSGDTGTPVATKRGTSKNSQFWRASNFGTRLVWVVLWHPKGYQNRWLLKWQVLGIFKISNFGHQLFWFTFGHFRHHHLPISVSRRCCWIARPVARQLATKLAPTADEIYSAKSKRGRQKFCYKLLQIVATCFFFMTCKEL